MIILIIILFNLKQYFQNLHYEKKKNRFHQSINKNIKSLMVNAFWKSNLSISEWWLQVRSSNYPHIITYVIITNTIDYMSL